MARPSKITSRRCGGHSIRSSGGFTLIESLIASVVLALAVVGVCGTLLASHTQTSALQANAFATSMARQLIEEISSLPLVTVDATAGWPTESNRAHYDSINDYHGYTDTASVTLVGGASTELAGGCTRSVSLSYPATLFGAPVTPGDWVLITVVTRHTSGPTVTLNKLVARATVVR